MESQDYWSDVNAVGDYYIRHDNVYTMKFVRHLPNLNSHLTALAQYGGPLAVFRRNDLNEESRMEIFNAVGQLITEFKWTSGNLLTMSWSSTESLVCVQTDGSVLIYQLMGGSPQLRKFYIDSKKTSSEQVASAKFYESQFGTGVAIATSTGRFLFLNGLENFSPKPLVGQEIAFSGSAWRRGCPGGGLAAGPVNPIAAAAHRQPEQQHHDCYAAHDQAEHQLGGVPGQVQHATGQAHCGQHQHRVHRDNLARSSAAVAPAVAAVVLRQAAAVLTVSQLVQRAAVLRHFLADLDPVPAAWCVLAPRPSNQLGPDQIRIFVLSRGGLLLLEQNRPPASLLEPPPAEALTDLCLSLDQSLLALWSEPQRHLTVYSLASGLSASGLPAPLSRHSLAGGPDSAFVGGDGGLLRMAWCANAAVMLVWADQRCLLPTVRSDRFANRLDEFHEGEGDSGAPLLVPEFDGLRLLTAERHDLLRPLPRPVEQLFNIACVSPATVLLLAHDTISGQARTETAAYELFLTIESDADKLAAVRCCLEAARFIAWPPDQKRVLRAARTGLALLPPKYSREHRTDELCQQLRLLNNLRFNESIGLPLTHAQFSRLGLGVLIDRLLNRRLHEFAFRACELLRLSESDGQARVMMHWAECQIDTLPPLVGAGVDIGESREDAQASDALVADIVKFVGQRPGVNYARLAGKAARLNRPGLARRLLDFETRSQDQVLLKLHNMRSELDLAGIMRKQPVAMALYQQAYCASDPAALLDQEDRRSDLAALELRRAFDSTEAARRQELLGSAASRFTEAGLPALAKECQLAAQLLERQRKLERDLSAQQFAGLSLHATLARLLGNGSEKLAESLRREFEVPEKRWWQLQVTALAKSGRFTELRRLSERKSPIGYAPFVNACLDAGNEAEAVALLPRVEREQRVRCLCRLRRYAEAIDFASGLKTDAAYHLEYLRRHLAREEVRQPGQPVVREAAQRLRALHQTMAAGGGGV
uniref:Vacuolar protein sorting-associated protein 16 homolog n=1 Tax=Macrostomum lignano TaxID=282301 RepID=A0A1I8IC97_9PLAT